MLLDNNSDSQNNGTNAYEFQCVDTYMFKCTQMVLNSLPEVLKQGLHGLRGSIMTQGVELPPVMPESHMSTS